MKILKLGKDFPMIKRFNRQAALLGLILSTALATTTVVMAQANPAFQQSGGMMGDHQMMPMGEAQMQDDMKMPAKMSPRMPDCGKMKGSMKAKCEKDHRHPVKATSVPAPKPKTMSTAIPTTAPQKSKPKLVGDEPMNDQTPMPDKMAPMKPGCC